MCHSKIKNMQDISQLNKKVKWKTDMHNTGKHCLCCTKYSFKMWRVTTVYSGTGVFFLDSLTNIQFFWPMPIPISRI